MSKRDLYIKAKPTTSPGWIRPADWLPMPTVLPTEQTFVGLHAIFPSGNNFAAFRFTTNTGNYQVDWGDGTITTHTNNTTAEHTYDYATYDPTNTTLSNRGYKQAIIVVSPVTGNLTTCNFQFRRTTTPAQNNTYATGFLDCILSIPNANTGASITFGGATVAHRYVERFDIKTIGNATSLGNLFSNCLSLQSVPLFDTQNVTNMFGMFQACNMIKEIPLFATQNVTNMQNMFNGCNSLETVPLFNTQNVTNMPQMFFGAWALKTVPLFNTQNVTSMNGMFRECYSLRTIPLFNTQNVTNMLNTFNNAASLQSIPLLNTALVQDFNQTFRACISLNTIPNLNTTAATNMLDMFTLSSSFDRTDIVCRVSVSFQNCQLSRDEIVNIFNNLLDRTSLASANINVSGNWGASALTVGDLLIATNKNWTVTT
jgi:surface protein